MKTTERQENLQINFLINKLIKGIRERYAPANYKGLPQKIGIGLLQAQFDYTR